MIQTFTSGMKGRFGAVCRLALNLTQLIGVLLGGEGTRHKADQVTGSCVTSAEVLTPADERVKGCRGDPPPKKSGHVGLRPLSEKWRPLVVTLGIWGGGFRVFWSTAPEEAAGDVTCSSTCPRLCRYLSKYSLSLLEISIYKCLSGALCVQFKYCSRVDIDGGHRSMAAKILQTGRIPEEWTPPSVSVAPLLLLLHPPPCNIPPSVVLRGCGGGKGVRGGLVEEEELGGTHSLQHTAANKRQMSVKQLLTNDSSLRSPGLRSPDFRAHLGLSSGRMCECRSDRNFGISRLLSQENAM